MGRTLSREGRRFMNITVSTRKRRGVRLPFDHPAALESRTLFPSTRRVVELDERVLKPGGYQRKLGAVVSKGAWAGMPIYALTLEERKTCPSTCHAWQTCYGNNMHRSKRYQPGPMFEMVLFRNLSELQSMHPKGFVVRLHILGDFYSLGYVSLWHNAMRVFPALRVFGYTARLPASDIGRALHKIGVQHHDRWRVRRSLPVPIAFEGESVIYRQDMRASKRVIVCPAQIDKTSACSTCALCWADGSWDKAIAFIEH